MKLLKDYREIDSLILERLGKGDTKKAIAIFLKCSESKIASRCKANGWVDSKRANGGKKGYLAKKSKSGS